MLAQRCARRWLLLLLLQLPSFSSALVVASLTYTTALLTSVFASTAVAQPSPARRNTPLATWWSSNRALTAFGGYVICNKVHRTHTPPSTVSACSGNVWECMQQRCN